MAASKKKKTNSPQTLVEALNVLRDAVKDSRDAIELYRSLVAERAEQTLDAVSADQLNLITYDFVINNKRAIWDAYKRMLKIFIIERLQMLSTFGTSQNWSIMKRRGESLKVGPRGGAKSINPAYADMFGFATGNLADKILGALASGEPDKTSGFYTLFEVSKEGGWSFDFDFVDSGFYKIRFKSGASIPYNVFLDDILANRTSAYTDINYTASGMFPLGILGMTPSEAEAIDRAAKTVIKRLLGTAIDMSVTQKDLKKKLMEEFMKSAGQVTS